MDQQSKKNGVKVIFCAIQEFSLSLSSSAERIFTSFLGKDTGLYSRAQFHFYTLNHKDKETYVFMDLSQTVGKPQVN